MIPRWLTISLLILTAAGCANDPRAGYAFTSAHRTDIKSVAVPIFGNDTFSHGLEVSLTDALVKEIHRSTPWRVTAAENAQTTLSGTIIASDLRKLSTQGDSGLVESLAVDLSVSFEWKDNSSGDVLLTRRNFRASRSFVPSRGARESLESGEQSTIDDLSKAIVAELRSSW